MNKTKFITLSALYCALIIVVSILIKIPNGLQGYIHLGDSIILLSSLHLPLPYALITNIIASGLTDLFNGYLIYIIPSMITKGLETIIFNKLYAKNKLIAYVMAIIIMISGYFISECYLFSLQIALISLIPNIIQGVSNAFITYLFIKHYQSIN